MEGDAGASRLNPNDTDDSSSSEVKTEDSAVGMLIGTRTKPRPHENRRGSGDGRGSRVDWIPRRGCIRGCDPKRRMIRAGAPVSRLGRGWLIGITAALLVLAVGVGTGGYRAAFQPGEPGHRAP